MDLCCHMASKMLAVPQAANPRPVICRGDAVRPPPKIAGERTASLRYMIGQGLRVVAV